MYLIMKNKMINKLYNPNKQKICSLGIKKMKAWDIQFSKYITTKAPVVFKFWMYESQAWHFLHSAMQYVTFFVGKALLDLIKRNVGFDQRSAIFWPCVFTFDFVDHSAIYMYIGSTELDEWTS